MRRILTFVFAAMVALNVCAEERFPQPQLPDGYVFPDLTKPMPRIAVREWLDVAVLAAALCAAAYFVLKARSRKWVLALTLFSIAYFGFWRKGCVCAVGAVQNVAVALADPSCAVPLSVLLFFLLPLVFALFFGRVFCAAVCPLGVLQDIFVVAPRRIPRLAAVVLGMIPFIYLGTAILLAAAGAGFVICRYDPFVSFFRLSGEPWIIGMGILFLMIGIFVARPYCRFFCPYSVLLELCSRFSKWHATITPGECVKCRLCEQACPFDAILVPNAETAVEPRSAGVRRVAILMALLPVVALTGGFAMSRLEPRLSSLAPETSIAEHVMEDESTGAGGREISKETEAFRSSGARRSELQAKADCVRKRMRIGTWIVGALVGIVFVLRLIGISLRRTREDYLPDKGLCLSCARCYMSCPKEHERLKK